MSTPRAAEIEILDPTHTDGAAVVPGKLRINGVEVMVPAEDPVIIHEIDSGSDAVKVTLTLFASRIVIGGESE